MRVTYTGPFNSVDIIIPTALGHRSETVGQGETIEVPPGFGASLCEQVGTWRDPDAPPPPEPALDVTVGLDDLKVADLRNLAEKVAEVAEVDPPTGHAKKADLLAFIRTNTPQED